MGKIRFQGREVEATEVDFLTRKEDWNEYQLSDGKILRLKTVVSDVYRIEEEVDQEGIPVYQIRSTNVVRVK